MKKALVIALLTLSVSSLMGQEVITARRRAAGGVVWPSGFTYVASSVTACWNGSSTQTKCVYALHQTPGAGHLLILNAGWDNGAAGRTAAITDPNNTWVAAGSPKVGGGDLTSYSGQTFYVASAVNAATTITMTISGNSNFISFEVAEYSYTGTILTLDPANLTGFNYSNTAASGGVATVNSAANTQSSSGLIVAGCSIVDSVCGVGSGYTARNDTNACSYNGTTCTTGQDFGSSTGAVFEEKTGVAAGSQSATFSAGTTDNVILHFIAF